MICFIVAIAFIYSEKTRLLKSRTILIDVDIILI